MANCNLCKKKFSFWQLLNAYTKDDKYYCDNCWKNKQEEILNGEELTKFRELNNEEKRKKKEILLSKKTTPEIAYLQNKIQSVEQQLFWNGLLTIGAIIYILYLPLTSFDTENFKITFDLGWIIAFIIMVIGLVRAITLRSKRTELNSDIDFKERA